MACLQLHVDLVVQLFLATFGEVLTHQHAHVALNVAEAQRHVFSLSSNFFLIFFPKNLETQTI